MRGPCFSCGGQGHDGHHPTGKNGFGRYLHPYLTFDQCHDCHELTHDDWRSQGIEHAGDTSNRLSILAIACQRLAVFLGRAAEHYPFLAGLARFLAESAADLERAIAGLDRDTPTWRQIPEVLRHGR